MHWGGGTPTFLRATRFERLVAALDAASARAGSRFSIESTRAAPSRRWRALAGLGFNRVSIGVQDFDPAVQKAVHRVQSVESRGA